MSANIYLRLDKPAADTLRLTLSGNWNLGAALPDKSETVRRMEEEPSLRHVTFDTTDLTGWDTGLLTFISGVMKFCSERNINVQRDGLPGGARRLLELAETAPEATLEDRHEERRSSFLAMVGETSFNFARSTGEMLSFIGEMSDAIGKTFTGRARFRSKDLLLIIEEVGANALPIITLISILVGMTLAFVGSVKLSDFNAELFVADLVSIGMLREMGAMMTGVIMAGRTGAAFAAHLGTMQVNEEIDALKTLGVPPLEYLVLPRMIALIITMPLLCIYADALGIIGGAIVGATMLEVPLTQYFVQTQSAVDLNDLMSGLIKAAVFGFIVALSGCLRGMQCGRSSEAVGLAATSAVVTGIVFIVVADSILTIIFTVTGF